MRSLLVLVLAAGLIGCSQASPAPTWEQKVKDAVLKRAEKDIEKCISPQ
jgi:hypothetical protein